MPSLHFRVLPKSQAFVWKFFSAHSKKLKKYGFYLAGGTALALQLGHRQSLDFDFFSEKRARAKYIHEWLFSEGLVLREWDENTIHAELHKTKVSFIAGYKYPLVHRPVRSDGIKLASVADIGLMKLLAITHRATLRDYLDLAAILRSRVPLKELLKLSRKKYGSRFNLLVPLKALVSFEDVDQEMPVILDKELGKKWQAFLRASVREVS